MREKDVTDMDNADFLQQRRGTERERCDLHGRYRLFSTEKWEGEKDVTDMDNADFLQQRSGRERKMRLRWIRLTFHNREVGGRERCD